MTLKERIHHLEGREAVKIMGPLDVDIIESIEQLDHPERFTRVLRSDHPAARSDCLHVRTYRLKRNER